MKVSICIPTYNSSETVRRLLDSIFVQTFTDYEVIVSDDSHGSEIENLIKHYEDNRLLYVHNEKSLGSPENWNNAIRYATGEYIKIMHHDDWFVSNNALQIMIDALEKSNADFVFCQSGGEGSNHPLLEDVRWHIEQLPRLLIANIIGAPSATMYRRTELMFDKNIKYYVDVDFYISYLKKHNLKYIQQELVGIGTTAVRVTDQVVSDRHFVYGEFQYAFLKLWNSKEWEKNLLLRIFNIYVYENRDFTHSNIEHLLVAQRLIILKQQVLLWFDSVKESIKRRIK